MDAQDAAGPDKTKPAAAAAASESKPLPDHEPPTETRPPKSTTPTNPSVIDPAPSPTVDKDVQPVARSPVLESADEKNTTDTANSDAETIVLPGKDGHSPSKVRKVKHEDKSEDDRHSLFPSPSRLPARPAQSDEGRGRERERREQSGPRERDKVKDGGKDAGREPPSTVAGATGSTDSALSQTIKKKRLHDKMSEKPSLPPPAQQAKDVSASTTTSSAPPNRPKSTDANPHIQSDSNSETSRAKSPRLSKDHLKGADRVIPHKRKAPPHLESDDEDEIRKARRQRTAPASTNPDHHPSKQAREQQQRQQPQQVIGGSKSHDHTRSVSPHTHAHRRSASTQLPAHSSSGLSQKKKRVPAPLQSTEYHSDESSASGSPHPRSSKLRSLATPATADSTVSPAKMGPHKKHLDAHGQTFLARACARGEYDQAKHRLTERPEDLNVADYAGNTPLQIAAINGCEDIVELLINAGCNLECVNYDKDTPLLDAVDNGHIAVVKLLLDAGVNPRKANVHGEEPLDRVNDELDNAEEIRSMLVKARRQMGDRRRTSEEHHDSRASYGPDESPRRSPTVNSSTNAQAGNSRRGGAVRSTKTSNHLLYMPMDDKTLRTAAGRGDEETVTRILQVRDGCDDPEAMVNAARGGHDLVMQLLLALGGANPDPPPVTHMSAEVATPMLAAIGQENIKVIQLLLDQANFDPTRRFKGETYYVIARRRQGTNWKEEEDILRKAYEGHKKPRPKDASKTRSPGRREREKEKDEREQKRAIRVDGKDDAARVLKRSATSPARSGESKKKVSSKPTSSPKEKRRSHDDAQSSPKRGSSRPKNDDRLPTVNVSDVENSPALLKQNKTKRADSELAGVSSEGETVKPRRKLVSKGELRGERGKQRRASQVSVASSVKDPSSPHDSRSDEHPEKEKPEKERLKSEKYHDRAKALKRDQSRDRTAVSSEGTKRHRPSATPPHSTSGDKDDSEAPTKKRRLDTDGKERRPKLSSLGEDRPAKPTMSRDQSLAKSMKAAKLIQKAARDEDGRRIKKSSSSSDAQRRESKSSSSDKSIHVKCEDADVDMKDAPPASHRDEVDLKKAKQLRDESEKKRAADLAEAAAAEEKKRREAAEEKEREKEREKKKREEEDAKRAEEAKRKEEEERIRRKEEDEKKRRKEEEERRQRAEEDKEKKRKEEEEQKRKEEEERKRKAEEERKRKAEEDLRKQKEEEERKRKEEEERSRREEEERKRREEAEKKRKEEEERLRKEEEERKKREAEEKRKREEEERLLREQLEREAAEAARRKREEDERREREHRERQRAAREAEFRRQREEQERLRLAKLPALLRWLETCPNPKTTALADKFKHMQGVRYDTIRPEANGTADGREQWVLNTQVALLLGEKDLSLSRYTAWERIPVSDLAKKTIWRLEAERYALTTPGVYDLGRQLPEYYGSGADPDRMTNEVIERLRREARDKFLQMNMFFVKLSDLLFIVPTIPHLRGLRLSVEYRELLESESQLHGWKASAKWKGDPDADQYLGFAPRHRYYVNGALVGVEKPKLSATSRTPFPEKRVPRRNGLTRVYPDEPDYAEICRKQGLEHLLTESSAPVTPNGVARPNGLSASVEETSPQAATSDRPHVNGINGESRVGA